VYIILCGGGGWEGGLLWHRHTHDGLLTHVDQNMTQLLIKLSIFGGSLALFAVLQTYGNYVCVGRLTINPNIGK